MPTPVSRALAFGQQAREYHRLRPPVPREVVDWMLPRPCDLAIDLGAGTGILTQDLATHAVRVLAIEPDPLTRRVLRGECPTVTVAPGRAESMPEARDGAADVVCVASAWHFVDVPAAVSEIARVLTDDGRLSVVWNHRDMDVAWIKQACALTDIPHEGGHEPGVFDLPERAPFGKVEHISVQWQRSMPTDDVVSLFGTYSATTQREPAEAARLLDQVRAIVQEVESGGFVDVPFRTVAYRTQRRPRPPRR